MIPDAEKERVGNHPTYIIMKNTFLILYVFLLCTTASAQETLIPFNALAPEQRANLINTSFAKIVTGQSTASIGAYAALDLDAAEVTLSPNFIWSNGNVMTVKFNGGVTEGVSSIFSDSKLNTNVSAGLQYNLLLGKGRSVIFTNTAYLAVNSAKIKSELDAFDRLYVFYELDKPGFGAKENEIAAHKARKDILAKRAEVTFAVADSDALLSDVQQLTAAMQSDMLGVLADSKKAGFRAFVLANGNTVIDQCNEADEKLSAKAYCITWLTFGYGIQNDEFRLFNPALPYEDQVGKEHFVSHKAKMQFSVYNYNATDDSWYLSIALTGIKKSNYLDLDKISLSESAVVGTSDPKVRQTEKKVTAYQGVYLENIDAMDANFDAYYFFSKFNRSGIHVYENSQFAEFEKPVHNIGIGVVYPFRDSEDETTIVNVEAYYTIRDTFNSSASKNGLAQRNDVGLRFTFPINFN